MTIQREMRKARRRMSSRNKLEKVRVATPAVTSPAHRVQLVCLELAELRVALGVLLAAACPASMPRLGLSK